MERQKRMDRHTGKHSKTETEREGQRQTWKDRDTHTKKYRHRERQMDTQRDRYTEIDTPTNILNSSRDLYEPKSPTMENTWVFLPTL